MKSILGSKATKIAAVVVVCFGLFAGGMAVAARRSGHVVLSGAGLEQTKVATDETGWGTDVGDTWKNVARSTLKIVLPLGRTSLLNAHFNAETYCNFTVDWCSARIVARKGSGPVHELLPRVGTDFAIDAPGGAEWIGASLDRSLRVHGGTWHVWVQGALVHNTNGSLYFDDWHFQVDVLE
jgi:hypothetical protein